MRIAFILPSLARKGPILVVKDIVDILVKNELVDKIKVFYFDDIVDVSFPCEVQKIRFSDCIKFDDFDVVHSHMLRPDIYIFKNKILGKMRLTKAISTLHQYNLINLKYDLNSPAKAFVASLLWGGALILHDRIVCLSKHMQNYYNKNIFLKRKLTYIYNGRSRNAPSFDAGVDSIKIPSNSIVVGSSCLLTKRKGLEQVIKIMPDIDNLFYIILGNGPEEESLKSLAKDLNVFNRCCFLGFKHNPLSYYDLFDVFLLPSRGEGFPLALLEAAMMKKSIVSSDLDVCREAFSSNEVCFFRLDDLEDLKRQIHQAYEKKLYYESNVFNKFINNYTSKVMALNYLNLYSSLISDKE